MTSTAPPDRALGDPADRPGQGPPAGAFDLDDPPSDADAELPGDAELGGQVLVGSTAAWWTRALTDDPLTGSAAERRRIRPAVAAATGGTPDPAQLATLDALLTAVGHSQDTRRSGAVAIDLTSREWLEVTTAYDRASSYLLAATLTAVAHLDRVTLTERPGQAVAKDTRRPASDELAPALRIAAGTATSLVGLARTLDELPAAEQALVSGLMTPAQFRALASVCGRLPHGAAGRGARAQVEAAAVAAAATLSRARLADRLEEEALAADPGYTARAMAEGIAARDVVLRDSPHQGCRRVVADLEAGDAARVWQVLNQIAANAEDGDTEDPDSADGGHQEREQRTAAQVRADVLVSLVVGDFTASPQLIAEALGLPDDDEEEGQADGSSDPEDRSCSTEAVRTGPPDTRRPVRLPTPEQRARLSEIHIVVLADDLADDDPDAPDDGRGPEDGPDRGRDDGSGGHPPPHRAHPTTDHADGADGSSTGTSRSSAAPPGPPGREAPRPLTGHPDQALRIPVPSPRRAPATGTSAPARSTTAGSGGSSSPGDRAAGRLQASRRARGARRRLAGYGPFGHVPGIGRLAPEITRAAIRAARWRRLVTDPGTGVLVHRSRWTLPAPDGSSSTGTGERSTGEHLALLLDQHAAPDPADPATRTEVSYRPSVLLAAHVRSRDGVCISPVCHHPARGGATQLDHTTAWGASTPTRLRGGLTEAGNLGCLCQRWHTAKTHGQWQLVQPSPGSFTWTSPLGRVYRRSATPVLPDLTDLLR